MLSKVKPLLGNIKREGLKFSHRKIDYGLSLGNERQILPGGGPRQLRQLWGFPEVRIVALGFPLSLLWELLQSPFYMDTFVDPWVGVFYNRIHCSVGDVFILLIVFWIVASVWGRSWMNSGRWEPLSIFVLLGVVYTGFSEYFNARVVGEWDYSAWMPTVAGIGLAPLLQWIVVPAVVVGIVRRMKRRDEAKTD